MLTVPVHLGGRGREAPALARRDSQQVHRPERGLRRRGLVALGALGVVVLAVVVPLAQQARWEHECAQRGGRLEHGAVDADPLLAPGSRLVYTCSGTDGQVLATWSW